VKKRLLALILTLMLALALVVPALMSDLVPSTSNAPPHIIRLASSGTSVVRDYAVVTAAQWNATRTSIAWRDFGAANVMLNGEVDISKIINVNAPSFLIVAQNSTVRNNKTMASLSSLANTGPNPEYIRYDLLVPARRPAITRPTFFDDSDGSPNAKYRLAPGLEYQRIGERTWLDVPQPEWDIPLNEYRVEYLVRTKGTADENAASQTVKLTVPALANAPAAKLDIVRGEIKTRSGWIVNTNLPGSTSTGTSLSAARTFTVGNNAENLAEGRIGSTSTKFMYRVPSTANRAGSGWATLHIGFDNNGSLAADKVGDYFVLTARNVLVIGAVPIQANVRGRWKTVKNIKFNEIPATGVEVRMAGTRTRLPGASIMLKLDQTTGTERGKLSFELIGSP
jgi:hypothetical protein